MDVKKYYLQFIEKGTDKSLIEKICLETNLTEKVVRAKLSFYNSKNATEEQRLKYEKVLGHLMEKAKPVDNKKYFPILIKIIMAKTKTEIIELIVESGIKSEREFSTIVTSYVIHISKLKSQEIVNSVSEILNRCTNIYRQYLNREEEKARLDRIAKKNSDLKKERYEQRIKTIKFLKDIATSKYQTSKEYLEANNIDKAQYDYAVKSIEDKEKPSFIEYCTLMVEKMKNSKFGDENLLSLIEKIVNGVDGRPFDLLDYYENTKLSLSEMSKLCNYGLDPENYRILKTFIGKDMSDEFFDIKKEREVKEKITINGIQIIPTAEDKQRAFNYLVEHNYPIDYKVYRIVLTRIILDFNKEKTLIK